MEHHWKNFWIFFLSAFSIFIVGFTVFFIIIDPYNILEFSPKLKRAPVVVNQRFAYPSIAKNPEYDSLVVGTSTSRLFQPEVLNKGLDANFAILSMNSATTYEQFKIFTQFKQHHEHIKHVIFGVDDAWCGLHQNAFNIYTSRPFPEWMYDDNPWNDYPNHYTLKTAETALKQFLYMIGLKDALFDANGYQNFLLDDTQYDIGRARELIYGSREAKALRRKPVDDTFSSDERKQLPLKALKYVKEIFNEVDEDTHVTLVMVPFHFYKTQSQRPVINECIRRIKRIASSHTNTTFLDFMIASEFTTKDENYWDPLHYRLKPSFDITNDIVAGIKMNKSNSFGRYEVLSVSK